MACYRPLYGWQRESGGPLVFGAERAGHRRVDIPCGYCIGCRLARARTWATRCMHEAQLSRDNCFVTLTYDDDKLEGPGLLYQDFQNFMRLLRRRLGYFDVTRWTWLPRYFMCGEYGTLNLRPHFHAIIFGLDFNDKRPYGKNTYRSPTLEKIWTKGYSSIGEANFQTAGYVARYSVKKRYGPNNKQHYERLDTATGEITDVQPEFAHMSLKPGIGYDWYKKYFNEASVARDGIVLAGGRQIPVPRYYMQMLETMDPDLRDWRQYTRYIHSQKFLDDCTPARLATREQCAIAQVKFNQERKL